MAAGAAFHHQQLLYLGIVANLLYGLGRVYGYGRVIQRLNGDTRALDLGFSPLPQFDVRKDQDFWRVHLW